VARFAIGIVIGPVGANWGDVGGDVQDCVGRWEKWEGVSDVIDG